ncbi:YqhV family protein [Tumebacillus sp. ITR2]|uniref:YqhV family protein n=1 Tax=Tumebacillus amylolyticus TaxID=2801339 RepID=A0ABS1J9Q5_9BACL|nr:YqhV family protein [Tumebacillus amylolyticus]MBL0387010.1 YqhV family protein [Tumebacillus amylolyticus]
MLKDSIVNGMAGLRLLSGLIEVSAALLMLYFGTVQKAVMINAGLALVGPTVLILVTTLGLIGMADKLEFWRMIIVMGGVGLILWGVRG